MDYKTFQENFLKLTPAQRNQFVNNFNNMSQDHTDLKKKLKPLITKLKKIGKLQPKEVEFNVKVVMKPKFTLDYLRDGLDDPGMLYETNSKVTCKPDVSDFVLEGFEDEAFEKMTDYYDLSEQSAVLMEINDLLKKYGVESWKLGELLE